MDGGRTHLGWAGPTVCTAAQAWISHLWVFPLPLPSLPPEAAAWPWEAGWSPRRTPATPRPSACLQCAAWEATLPCDTSGGGGGARGRSAEASGPGLSGPESDGRQSLRLHCSDSAWRLTRHTASPAFLSCPRQDSSWGSSGARGDSPQWLELWRDEGSPSCVPSSAP